MKYPDKKVPLKVLIQETLTARLYGLKTLYYQNTRSTDQADGLEEVEDDGCAGGGCKI
jgi:ribonucleoside-diphosphate reductase alpha chain